MAKFKRLRTAVQEPESLDASVVDSVLVSPTRRHEIRSDVGFVGTLVSALLTLVLLAGVAGGAVAAVRSIWSFIHLPDNVALPALTLPKLPQVNLPEIHLPQWLRDRLPQSSPNAAEAPASTQASTASDSSNRETGPSVASRESALIAAVRAETSTKFDDAALLDLGRSACTASAQGSDNQSRAARVGNDAERLASVLGVETADAQAAAQSVLNNLAASGLCGN